MPLNLPTYKPLTCGLYVVTTPIGNMADITLRALSILATVDLIAAEDTRHTRRLLAAHDIDNHLISYHEHNEKQRTTELIAKLDQGAAIALFLFPAMAGVAALMLRLARRTEVI